MAGVELILFDNDGEKNELKWFTLTGSWRKLNWKQTQCGCNKYWCITCHGL